MKNLGVRISDGADLRLLSVNVIRRAVDELREHNLIKAVDAVLFLTGQDFPIWAEMANLPFADPWKMLISGRAKKGTRTKGRKL